MWVVFLFQLLVVGWSLAEALPSKNSSHYYIDGGAVVVFESQQPSQLVNDVLESILYAQMMASHAYSRFSEFSQWYAAHIKAYEEIGWTIYTSDFELSIDNHSSSDRDAIRRVLSKDLSSSEQDSVCDALDIIHSNATVMKSFNQETSEGSFSNFQVLMLKTVDSGNAVMSFTGFVVNVVNSKFRELFSSFGLGILKDGNFTTHREYVTSYLQDSTHLIKRLATAEAG